MITIYDLEAGRSSRASSRREHGRLISLVSFLGTRRGEGVTATWSSARDARLGLMVYRDFPPLVFKRERTITGGGGGTGSF